MGLFSTLHIGSSGLFASQLAMDITGQNISNADVEGYSRKRLNLCTSYRYDGVNGQVGMGVDTINIERVRNSFIDEQIRRQNQEVGTYDEISTTLESIENIFSEPSDTGLVTYVDQFFDSWQNLANNPSDLSARTMVKTNAEILSDVFHNLSGELTNLRQTRNDEIIQRMNKVNEYCKEIFNLNSEIGAVEISNQNANDSRDRRDLILKELSKLIDVTTVENDQGQLTITSDGNILVSPVGLQELETSTGSVRLPDQSTITEVSLRLANSKRPYKPQSGQIAGLFESRDSIIPQYQLKLDELARSIASSVNELHEQGFTLDGISGISFFNKDVTGASDIALSASILSNLRNIAAASGGEAHIAVQNVSNAASHTFGGPNVQLVRDPGATPPVNANNVINGTVIVRSPTSVLTEGTDYFIDYASGSMQMLHNGYDGTNLTINFQYRTTGFSGPGNNANAVAIAGLRSDLTMNQDILGNGTSTFTEYYSSVIGNLGLSRNEADSNLQTREYLISQYEAHQDSIAGVSLDDEMASLIKYQHTYQAAARLISTTSEMLDVLMNM
ncbi:MAG TPA: flagellar hook-associated protein FlgK [Chitinispirillaceae bacterium]|nr:flagellar hook-associated protein FlgK [Chitinispirillaceae bacterium]